MKGRSRLYPISIIMMAAFLAAGPANAVYAAEPNGSWVNLDGNWYWKYIWSAEKYILLLFLF